MFLLSERLAKGKVIVYYTNRQPCGWTRDVLGEAHFFRSLQEVKDKIKELCALKKTCNNKKWCKKHNRWEACVGPHRYQILRF